MHHTKNSIRNERDDNFKSKYLDLIALEYDVEYMERTERYTIYNTEFGDLDFYPKANKLLIRKQNKWIKPGLNWLLNKLNIEV